MINPSTSGWIDKFFFGQNTSTPPSIENPESYYQKVRDTGFIYGYSISLQTSFLAENKGWTEEEKTKISLLNSLFGVYKISTNENDSVKFISKVLAFYEEIYPQGFNFFEKILSNKSNSLNLEKHIDERVQTNIDIIKKQFSHVLTNALLFLDVLAFQYYLKNNSIPEKYFKKIEETIISLVSLALKTKSNKTKYDDLLIKLFEASVRYTKFSSNEFQKLEDLKLDCLTSDLEKYYFIDITVMALWSEETIKNSEAYFLYNLAEIMNVSDDFVVKSISETNNFILKHKDEIPYFKYSNPVKHFFDHTSQNVEVLITRNKKRLQKELLQSKELMILLAKSTRRDLDEKEKKKVKKQLLDICKSIPSLTIFLLPGGTLLLPILIKFIPKLLPSSFNENLDME